MSISLLLKLPDAIIERFNLVFLLHNFRSCLTKQMIDGSACLKTELLNWFSGSSLLNESNAVVFPGALGSWNELDIKLFLKSA